MLTLLAFAFLAGLAASLSPCVLVVLPLVLSSSLQKSRAQPIATIIGLTVSFAFFTLFLGSLVQAIGISATALRYISIAIVFVFGLTLLLPFADRIVAKIFNPFARVGAKIDAQSRKVKSPILSGLVLGVAIGLLWTPCAGPILASVIAVVATQQISLEAVLIVSLYAIGSSIPLFAFALFGQHLVKTSQFLNRHVVAIRRVFGVLMITTSILLFMELDTKVTQWMLQYVPTYSIDANVSAKKETGRTAPNFVGIAHWINSPPLSIESLRGKVVLVDFWTYSCINCVRNLPYLIKWYDTYKSDGFVIVGVHTPEFEFEKDLDNVKRATEREGIRYPVALDSDYKTWTAYNNSAWPEHYLIDQNGVIREVHLGEGDYEQTEQKIRALLGKTQSAKGIEELAPTHQLTPETYLGYARAQAYEPSTVITKDAEQRYAGRENPGDDQVSLQGLFKVAGESITSLEDKSTLQLNFAASHVYLVMSGSSKTPVKIWRDNRFVRQIIVDEAKMYDVLSGKFGRHVLKLEFPKGISAYAFTFGDD
jgi:cytochrome c biogenesis protein CcdA/thiol-disulfide isomerase/thioredoxin